MPTQKKLSTVDIAQKIIEPVIKELGIELWDVRFEKEGSSWYLRYFIDKPDGVNIIDCENVSRAVDKLLDAADPIVQNYILEVSSPGTERALTKDEHFKRFIGSDVTVRLIRPVEGKREFVGELLSKEGDEITILLEEDLQMTFLKNEAAFVRLYVTYDFN